MIDRNSELLEGVFEAFPSADIRPCDAAQIVLRLWEILLNEHTSAHHRLGSQKACNLCVMRLSTLSAKELNQLADEHGSRISRMISRMLLQVRRGQCSRNPTVERLKAMILRAGWPGFC